MMAPIKLACDPPANARRPVTISYSTAPSEKGHVLVRAEHRAGGGQRFAHRRRHREIGVAVETAVGLGEPEIQELGPRRREHDVAGFDVAVDDTLAMRLLEGIGDLDPVPQGILQRHRPLAQPLAEGLAVDELHDEIIHAVLVADVVQRTDIRMRQAGYRLRLALHALAQLRRLREMIRQDFDRDDAVETGVACPVDLTHATRANRLLDLIRPQTRTLCNRHVAPCIS